MSVSGYLLDSSWDRANRETGRLPKAACRRVAVTPPPPASRRSGGGGVTAYMPGKLVVESGRERKELKTGSVKRKSARGGMGVGGKRREGKPSKRKSLTPKGMKQRRAGGSAHKHSSQPSKPSKAHPAHPAHPARRASPEFA